MPGDKIGVMAPSSHVELCDLDKAGTVLENKGFKVFIHPQSLARLQQSAGSHAEKIAALHELFADPSVKAIIAAGGGNRALHLLDKIDYNLIEENPKILMGFSDVTALLNAIYAKTGLTTYHGPVFKKLADYEPLDAMLAVLAGEKATYDLRPARVIREGEARGPMIGGNLCLFQYLCGTAFMPDADGAILFLEDCNEELSRIDRMLLHLRRMGVLERICGLLLGEFSDMKDTGRPFGFTLEDLVREHTDGLNIPIVMDAPFGHGKNLPVFPVGGMARLTADGADAALRLL